MKVLPKVPLKNLFNTPINAEDEEGNTFPAEISFKEFVLQRLADAKFSADMEAVVSALQIKQAVEDADDVLALETADWTRLVEVVKKPSQPYNPVFAVSLVPFMKEVANASDTKPE